MQKPASGITLVPFRLEKGIAHFEVSNAGFGDLRTQVEDAINFLRFNVIDLQKMMNQPDASGVLDFAVEWRDVAVQYDTFPAELIREAGSLGLSLELSHYPGAENSDAG